ncbi:MAG: class I SAM-dependent methyltransferase, partial [Pseudomonadota bacterium]
MAQQAGASFLEQDVVDLYRYRPPYPQQVFDLIVDLSPGSDRMLDLGCGHGKIARPMSQHFNQVVAVDPSAKMIALGKTLPHGAASNLTWVEEYAEDVQLRKEPFMVHPMNAECSDDCIKGTAQRYILCVFLDPGQITCCAMWKRL